MTDNAPKQVLASVPPAVRKAIVADFLRRCNTYADAKIAQYRQADAAEDAAADLARNEKLTRWLTYRSFNLYALGELDGTELDDWFA